LIEEFIHDRDSSRDEEENHYVSPENFEWTDEYSVHCKLLFAEKPGPISVIETSANVLDNSQISSIWNQRPERPQRRRAHMFDITLPSVRLIWTKSC
jgi:hypothetical protein